MFVKYFLNKLKLNLSRHKEDDLQEICGYLEDILLTSKNSSYHHNISIIHCSNFISALPQSVPNFIDQSFVIIITYESLNKHRIFESMKIILSASRGTRSVYSESDSRHWISENKPVSSIISKSEEGQKISAFKGTNVIRINQRLKIPQIPTKRVRILNKGTQRKIIEN